MEGGLLVSRLDAAVEVALSSISMLLLYPALNPIQLVLVVPEAQPPVLLVAQA
jgi:hypothetical protein